MANLVELPADVHRCLAAYLTDHKDLASLAKTCRTLYTHAVARLYHTITLDDNANPEDVAQMFNVDNAALQYIRHIALKPMVERHPEVDVTYQGIKTEIVQSISQLLPRDTLRTFTIDGEARLPLGLICMLYRRQRRLEVLRVDDDMGVLRRIDSASGELLAPGAGVSRLLNSANLAAITTVHLYISAVPSILAARDIVAACHGIRKLYIDFDGYTAYGRTLKQAIARDKTRKISWAIMQFIFGHAPVPNSMAEYEEPKSEGWAVTPVQAMSLSSLRLRGLDLSAAAAVFQEAVKLDDVTELECYSCYKVEALLSLQQGDQHVLHSLKRLTIFSSAETKHTVDDQVMDAMLMSFSGLEHLALSSPGFAQGDGLPDVEAITHHAQSLRSLYVDGYDTEEEYAWSSESIKQICEACTRLRQLAIGSSGLGGEDGEGIDDWPGDAFDEGMEAISRLPELETLFLLNTIRGSAIQLSDGCGSVGSIAALRDLADRAFDTAPNVSGLAIGRARQCHKDEDWSNKTEYFLREQRIALGGRTEWGAHRVPCKEDLQSIIPLSDILDARPERDTLPMP